MKITLVIPNDGVNSEFIMQAFCERAGEAIKNAIQAVLGTEGVYTLSEAYRKAKMKSPLLKRIAGKASDQPLILSAAMYESIEWTREGNTLSVGVPDEAGFSDKGFDYAEHWEVIAQYLEKALAFMGGEDRLSQILEDVIAEEIGAI